MMKKLMAVENAVETEIRHTRKTASIQPFEHHRIAEKLQSRRNLIDIVNLYFLLQLQADFVPGVPLGVQLRARQHLARQRGRDRTFVASFIAVSQLLSNMKIKVPEIK
jgi:hypothetical protein